jgi:putative ABC transport system ATP-binding protein
MDVIKLTDISKVFGLGNGATVALKSLSLQVPKGEFLVIMGPSGSGKSTLLNIIGLLDRPDEGEYLLDTHDVSYLNERKRAKIRRNNIGFIFQNFNLISRLNVLENVSLPLLYKGISTVKRYERASEILKYLGIQEKEYYSPHQLSGGQLQRAAIARAMVNRPSIVLADEPTGNLDTAASKVIMAALKEIHEAGNTIIMVTHNPDMASYADRVIKLVDGRIEEELTGNEIKKDVKEQKKEAEETVPAAQELRSKSHESRKSSKKTSGKKKPGSKKKTDNKKKKSGAKHV